MRPDVATRLRPVPLVPEIRLYLADGSLGLFEAAGGGYHSDEPPPFWAFAWAGGQALARYLLDHPELVAGRRVVDLGSGSGLVAIAAARAGAAAVTAVDTDPTALAAVSGNAVANGVGERVATAAAMPPSTEVVVAGDVFYSPTSCQAVLASLRSVARNGARVTVGDADREYLPKRLFRPLARYRVPVPEPLEGLTIRPATVWELRAPHATSDGE